MFSRKRRQGRSSGRGAKSFLRVWLASLFLVMCAVLFATEKLQELQEHFDRETHASNKIKVLEKLGPAQFNAAGSAAKAEDFNTVGLTFEKYRDNVRTCFDLLTKQEPDADKHGETYRHLELQTRRGLREVDEMMNIVPPVVQPPLQIVKQDLIGIDNKLIQLLFPRRSREPQSTPPAPEKKP
jgi:hypothetical protein